MSRRGLSATRRNGLGWIRLLVRLKPDGVSVEEFVEGRRPFGWTGFSDEQVLAYARECERRERRDAQPSR